MRTVCANGLHLVTQILGAPRNNQKAKIWHAASDPAWKQHADEYRVLKGPGAVLQKYLEHARGETMRSLVVDTFSVLTDMDKLAFIGLQTIVMSPASQKTCLADGGILAAEAQTSEDLFKSVLSILEQRAQSMCHYSSSLPFGFVLLASDEPADVQRALTWLEQIGTATCRAERRKHDDQAVASLFSNIPFLSWAPVRGILVLLAQVSFRVVPTAVLDMVMSVFSGWGSSLVNELGFKTTRMHGKVGSNSRMTPVRRWYHAAVDGPLPQFERKGIDFDANSRGGQTAALPAAIFKSTACDESVVQKELDGIMDKSDWTSFSATSKPVIPAGLALLLWASSSDKWSSVGAAWAALLCQVGDVVRHKQSSDFYLVLHCPRYGFLGVLMECKRLSRACGGKAYCNLRLVDGAAPCAWQQVVDYTQWVAYPVSCSPPITRLGTSNPQGVLLTLENHCAPLPLIVRAAQRAFKGMTGMCLDRLSKQRGLELEKVVTSKVVSLVRDVLPDLSDEALREILLHRLPQSVSRPVGVSSVPDGILEPGDKKEFADAAKQHETTCADVEKLREQLAPGSKCQRPPQKEVQADMRRRAAAATPTCSPPAALRPLVNFFPRRRVVR